MSNWGEVSGTRIVRASLGLPLLGAWVADVALASDVALPKAITLTIGNLTLAGAVYRQAQFAGRTTAVLVAGANGWSSPVEARAYNNPGGVLLSQVLSDAATEVGERVEVAADGPVGNFFWRFADRASRVLRALAGPEWWIDDTGTTQVGPRTGSAVASSFQVISFDGAAGLAEVSSEDPASWLPGATFSTPALSQQTVASVRHELSPNGRARLLVMVQ
jgi:hypothetical protein